MALIYNNNSNDILLPISSLNFYLHADNTIIMIFLDNKDIKLHSSPLLFLTFKTDVVFKRLSILYYFLYLCKK